MSKARNQKRVKQRESNRPHPSFMTASLHCFFTVARIGSIRAAADQLNIAPSAVSRHIAKLETALGTTLFDRLPRGLRLSSSGELFLYHALESAKQIDRARALIGDMQGLKRGHVTIATTENIAMGPLPPMVASFWARYPDISVAIHSVRSIEAYTGVVRGDYELAIGFDMPADIPLRVLASARLAIGAWVPKSHPLAASATITLAQAMTERLLLPDETVRLRSLLNPQLRHRGSFKARLVSNSTAVLEIFASLGCGFALQTKIGLISGGLRQNAVFRPIEDLIGKPQTIQLCARAGGLSPSGLALASHLSEGIQSLADK
jgi:DNA-binding transcriptional LysR family regulator